jgi:alkylated DNA nucleotide flippase Atl1
LAQGVVSGERDGRAHTPAVPVTAGLRQTPVMDQEEYAEAVLRLVETIPPGRVMSYGAIAELVGRGGPRQVGHVMATYGGAVPWWRVVRADGTLPASHKATARQRYLQEGTPLRGGLATPTVVDMASAAWTPPGDHDLDVGAV